MVNFASLAHASGLTLPELELPAVIQEFRQVEDKPRWRWKGVIVGRVWKPDVPEQEIEAMRVGGRRRLARPDEVTASGTRIYKLTPDEQRQAQKLMSRECQDGFESDVYEPEFAYHNVACNAGRSTILNFLAGSGSHTGITFFAVGTGAGTPVAGDTSLFTEVFRKAITTATVTGNQVDESTFFATTDGNFSYTNAGAFGDGATSTLGTGVLFAHAVYLYNKNSSVALTNDYLINMN